MKNDEQRKAAKEFAEFWQGKGYEKGQSQPFWLSLLRDVYGVAEPEKYINFEDKVMLEHTSFIDGFIPSAHVLIEQKELGKNLKKPIKQSDGSLLSPFQQAKRYSANLPYSQRPRYIITCNFESFLVYDMENPQGEPEEILLKNLPQEYYRLNFLVDSSEKVHLQKELEVSVKAGALVGKLYDALLKQYIDPENPHSLQSLNILCVRLVFCLYAEDADIFGRHGIFHDYLAAAGKRNTRRALIDLFKVLDTKEDKRDPYMDETLAAFPYTNGGLFADENIEIPQFTDEIIDLLLVECSEGFDWSDISPTIFGAVFESTLNPATRRSGGMHYTSIENIHKVIDPLFLDDLKQELQDIKEIKQIKKRNSALQQFQGKISSLNFLDPACGSGNFLTETYISLRRLENEVLSLLMNQEISFGDWAEYSPIKVSISQFYGIEINDFAVTVAKAALWIAESQMMKETEDIVHFNLDFLPLKTNAHIVEANALRINWREVITADKLNYIMGNPPFVGAQYMSKEQKEDIFYVCTDTEGKRYKNAGKLDFVAGWYFKAALFVKNTNIECAFVSTNSIAQGEQTAILWEPLFNLYRIHISFAYRTFRWDSEASLKAHVHCVIIGFSARNVNEKKYLFYGEQVKLVNNINAYLMDAPDIFIHSRKVPICNVPKIRKGNQPTDGGNLIIEANELNDFLKKEPNAKPYIKKLIGSREYINNKPRFCLWLVNVPPSIIRKMPFVMQRVEKVREMRLNSTDKATRKLADSPTVFRETNNPATFIVVPSVSSERRKYIPMGFLDDNTISTNLNLIIPNATIYHFGILTSNVHMAWMRTVAGRLEMRYRYSKDIVYNNFPWPTPTDAQKAKIEKTAQAILDARALYPDSSLADLYDELTMPKELRRAHQENDKAVMTAYGFDWRSSATSESQCVAELMKMYQQLTARK